MYFSDHIFHPRPDFTHSLVIFNRNTIHISVMILTKFWCYKTQLDVNVYIMLLTVLFSTSMIKFKTWVFGFCQWATLNRYIKLHLTVTGRFKMLTQYFCLYRVGAGDLCHDDGANVERRARNHRWISDWYTRGHSEPLDWYQLRDAVWGPGTAAAAVVLCMSNYEKNWWSICMREL